MLGKLFKPRWQHRDAEVRAQAVATLDPRQDQETVSKLARDDDSARVRAVAVAALFDLNLLDQLIETDTDAGVRDAASERFVALLAGTVDGAPSVDTRLRLIEHTGNARVLLHVARHSPDEPCRNAALAGIEDPDALYRLALDGADAALRLAAAERLEEPALLRQLGREGRDKKVVRLARDRVKALQARDAEARRQGEQLDALIEALEQLAQHSSDPLFEGRLQQLEQRWRGLAEHADEARAARVESALGQCHGHLREQREAAAQQEAKESAAHERQAALDTLRSLYRDLSAETWDQQLGELRSAVATQERRWQAAGDALAGDDESDLAFHSQLNEWHRLIGLAEAALDVEDQERRRELADQWPTGVPAPTTLTAARPSQPQSGAGPGTSEPGSKSGTHSERAAGPSEHRGLVVALRRELQQGNLKHANRLWHKAEAVLAEQSDPWLHQQLERLTPRREELRDWHAFAAQPKKEQLCERMEALAGTDMDAEERASAVQALHEEWRALMSSDQDQDQALWDRFKAASDRAYEPCRAHFAELDAQRAENLRQREALCRQLADFVAAQDWRNADWQAVWEIRRQAPREWKSHAPVRFTDARDVQKRFSSLLSEIDERLEQAWREAEQPRQALLQQADALAESVNGDVHGAARDAQALQKQWRAAPWLPPARHRPYQKRFRRAMDTIFAARQADSEHKQAQRAEAADQARAVLERAARQTALPLPEQDGAALAALAEELQTLDGSALDRGPRQQLQRLQDDLRTLRKDLPRWRRWQAACERVKSAPSGEERAEDRALAAALEALAGVDSPEHAREERMAWQLERLPKAMKSSGFTPLEEALALVDERPVGTPLDSDLASRMTTALTALEPRP